MSSVRRKDTTALDVIVIIDPRDSKAQRDQLTARALLELQGELSQVLDFDPGYYRIEIVATATELTNAKPIIRTAP